MSMPVDSFGGGETYVCKHCGTVERVDYTHECTRRVRQAIMRGEHPLMSRLIAVIVAGRYGFTYICTGSRERARWERLDEWPSAATAVPESLDYYVLYPVDGWLRRADGHWFPLASGAQPPKGTLHTEIYDNRLRAIQAIEQPVLDRVDPADAAWDIEL